MTASILNLSFQAGALSKMPVTFEIRMLYISLDPLSFLQIISTKLGRRGNSFFGLVRPFFRIGQVLNIEFFRPR